MKNRCLLLVLSLLGIFSMISAEEQPDTLGIIHRIAVNPQLTVNQPKKLAERLLPELQTEENDDDKTAETKTNATSNSGYRIQVYSGNNPRTSRSEAHSRSAAIKAEFPEWATYVTFDSPYWRVKVGDFRNYSEATAALSLLKSHFPAFGKEMRLVRDKIRNGN